VTYNDAVHVPVGPHGLGNINILNLKVGKG
jgi:hypothetical protein